MTGKKVTLKDLGWHLRGADAEKDLSGTGWVHEHEEKGYKTRVCATLPDAALAARRLQRLSEDPSADLRNCPECRFTYDANDMADAEPHADHAHSTDVSADAEESKGNPAQDEELLLGELKDFLQEQEVEITASGTTPFSAASFVETSSEVVVVACDQRPQGLEGCILDAMRRRTSPIQTACVVACCADDLSKYEESAVTHGVEVLTFDEFEASRTLPLSDAIIRKLEACDTLPDFQRLISTHALQRVMDYESDARFDGAEFDRLYDAINAAAERVGLRRTGEEESAGAEGATQNISGGDSESVSPAAEEEASEQNVAAASSESLFDESESSRGASPAGAQRLPEMRPSKIRRHPLLLMRAAGLDEGHVRELEEVLKSGGRFKDPNVVFFDGEVYWNAAGNHRHEAALRQNALLDVDVRNGSFDDAVEFAAGSNYDHGLKRSDNDKRLAVVTLLANAKNFGLSDGLLAKKAHVTPPFVGDVRDYVARLIPHIDGDAGAEQLAERAGVPAGLAHVVLSLPDETFSSLSTNVTNDDGRRLGGDGRVYTVKPTPAAQEDSTASLFDEPSAASAPQQTQDFVDHPESNEVTAAVESPTRTETRADIEADSARPVVKDRRRFANELPQPTAEGKARADAAESKGQDSRLAESVREPEVAPTHEGTSDTEEWGPEWEQATIVVTLRMLPDDKHVDGRKVMVAAHDDGGTPLTKLTRIRHLGIERGDLDELLKQLSAEMPARCAARKQSDAKPSTAVKTTTTKTTVKSSKKGSAKSAAKSSSSKGSTKKAAQKGGAKKR